MFFMTTMLSRLFKSHAANNSESYSADAAAELGIVAHSPLNSVQITPPRTRGPQSPKMVGDGLKTSLTIPAEFGTKKCPYNQNGPDLAPTSS